MGKLYTAIKWTQLKICVTTPTIYARLITCQTIRIAFRTLGFIYIVTSGTIICTCSVCLGKIIWFLTTYTTINTWIRTIKTTLATLYAAIRWC